MAVVPGLVTNWINGEQAPADSGATLLNVNPADGSRLCEVAASGKSDVDRAVAAAKAAQPAWAARSPVERGDLIRAATLLMRERCEHFASIVAAETGKSMRDARGETGAAVEMGMFIAGEGRRYYGRTTTSGVPHRAAMIVRQPVGVAGLIIAANTPIANVAWKVFPSLLCGNGTVLKAAEDTPATAWAVAEVLHEVGVPAGVCNVVQGFGPEAGQPLVEHEDVDLVSFTGSAAVGRSINGIAARRLAKVCMELGGKNALVVCDDADLERATDAAVAAAYSNAGQRCASGSRIIVFDAVYEEFRAKLLAATEALRLGPGDDDDLGPVINERQLLNMLASIERARGAGAKVLTGGKRLTDDAHASGFYMAPTLIEGAPPGAEISRDELFGPITCLYRVADFQEALALANDSPFGLTAAIHTRSLHRASEFADKIRTGVVSINGPTHGSEPHMPFGGLKQSGNGLREAGTEALDVYSEWKTVYTIHDPELV